MSPVDFLVQTRYHIKLELLLTIGLEWELFSGLEQSHQKVRMEKYCLMPGAQWSGALLAEPAAPLPAPPCLLRPHSPLPPPKPPDELAVSPLNYPSFPATSSTVRARCSPPTTPCSTTIQLPSKDPPHWKLLPFKIYGRTLARFGFSLVIV